VVGRTTSQGKRKEKIMYHIAIWLEKLFYLLIKLFIKLFILLVLIISVLLILQHFSPEEATKSLDADDAIGEVTLLIFSIIVAFILWILGLYFYHFHLNNKKENLDL
jgi:hypothetical protein